MSPSRKCSVLFCEMLLLALATSSQGQSPDKLEWQVRSDPSEKNVVAEAVAAGKFVAGTNTGTSQFILACERGRNRCADCDQLANQVVTMYRLSWIIPPQPSFYFEPFTLGGGARDDLATVEIG